MKSLRFWSGVVAVFVFLISYQFREILMFTGIGNDLNPAEFSIFTNACQILLCLSGISLFYRCGMAKSLVEIGLFAPFKRAFVFALIATLPMSIGFAFTSYLSTSVTFLSVFAFAIVSPFAEEVVFRGYIFRQLYRRAGLGFWVAALMPSLLFGLGHLYQARGFSELAGVLAITGLGSVFFCWIFSRWQDNLWVPFGLHFLMNFYWMVFAVDESAIGGWFANIVRLLTVAIAIGLTIKKDSIWARLPIEDRNVAEIKEDKNEVDAAARRMAAA
ncbi:MAG: CPBP family intramembrane metalloprotease [Acidobacteriota bacterium]|nr:CPBP family intramembrane metalloprotease [Acidobacteriota bacterium]